MELKRTNKGFNAEFRNFRAPAPFLIGQAAWLGMEQSPVTVNAMRPAPLPMRSKRKMLRSWRSF